MPRRGPSAQLPAADRAQTIELGLAVVLGQAPFGLDEPCALEAMECRVERAFADGHRGLCGRLDPFDDGVSVPWSPTQRLEDEQVERAAGETDLEWVHERQCTIFPIAWQWERFGLRRMEDTRPPRRSYDTLPEVARLQARRQAENGELRLCICRQRDATRTGKLDRHGRRARGRVETEERHRAGIHDRRRRVTRNCEELDGIRKRNVACALRRDVETIPQREHVA